MAQAITSYYQLNRGLVSRLGLARMDIKRTAISAAVMTNFIPRVLGSMMLRPGLGRIGDTFSQAADTYSKFIPFIFSTDDTALVEVTSFGLRFWVDDALVTRPSVSSAVTNGFFTASLAGWTASAGWTWSVYSLLGAAVCTGDGSNDETLDQTVVVAGGDLNVLHSLTIEILNGPVRLRVGTAAGDDNYVQEATLQTGTHSIAFIPSGNFTIRFISALQRQVAINQCTVGASGTLMLSSIFYAQADLYSLRWDQSGDVLFVACAGNDGTNYKPKRIERRENNSWSFVDYLTIDGPYRTENTSNTTMLPSGSTGNITVTASEDYFSSGHVGALFSITQQGQYVSASLSASNTFTNPIKVEGVDEQRRYTTVITGVWVGTLTLQYSVGVVGNWVDSITYTGNATASDKDGLDNQIVYYRIGFKAGAYTSGTAVVSLTYSIGRIRGVVRVTGYTSKTVVAAEVIKTLGANLVATDIWSEGSWSTFRGFPTSNALYEGRLWWAGKNGIFGSVSDAFDDFSPDDDGTAGAAGTINRTIGSGPVDDINFLLPLQRLIIGAEGTEYSARSTAFDEPLTPTNFNIKGATTQGSANVLPVKIDSRGAFVQRSGSRVYELAYSGETNDYALTDLTAIVPEVCEPSVLTMAVQRQPDTRVHCVLSDGTVAIAVIDSVENVLSWQKFETDGSVVDAVVLPGDGLEDAVYYEVDRTFEQETGIVVSLSEQTTEYTYEAPNYGVVGARTATTQGLGYVVGDLLTVVGGTFTRAAVFRAHEVSGTGQVQFFAVVDPGDYTVAPSNPVSFTGGSGSVSPTVDIVLATDRTLTLANSTAGFNFQVPPTLAISGDGTGATATATMQVGLAQSFAAGSGYTVGDTLTLSGGTFTTACTLRVETINGSGAPLVYSVIQPGVYTVPSSVYPFSTSLTGGTGTLATVVLNWCAGPATVTAEGTGYDTTASVAVTATFGSGASYTATLGTDTVTTVYRFLERWAKESECVGGTLNKQADSFALFTSATATTVIDGLEHLEGRDVVAWGNGVDLSPDVDGVQTVYRVVDAQIGVISEVTSAVVGLPYTAQWQSTKLAQVGDQGSWLNQRKNVSQLGLIMADVHAKGIKYGPEFSRLDPLPEVENSAIVPYNTVYEEFDFDMMEFPGGWDTDSRICLECQAPRPCTVLAITFAIEEHGKG